MSFLWNIINKTNHIAFLLVFLGSSAVLGAAYVFQYGFGYAPCELCYYQRYPYMAVMAVAAIGVLAQAGMIKLNKQMLAWLLLICGLLLFVDAGIAAFHTGVEYKWWEGPTSCTPTLNFSGSVEDRLAQLLKAPIIRCDTAPWSLFGISMAGYNFFLATGLGIFAMMSWSKLKKQ